MTTAILFRAGAGVPGIVTEQTNKNVRTAKIDPNSNPPQVVGYPVKIVNGYIEAIQTGDTAADFYGILARSAPSIASNVAQSENFGSGVPNAAFAQNVLIRGYITVVVAAGTPVVDQPVYMRVVENLPLVVGDLEAISVPGENVLLPGVTWSVEGADANLVTGIRVS